MKSLSKQFSNIELSGCLRTKEIKGKYIVTLSEEVLISIHNLPSKKKRFYYSLIVINKDKNKKNSWEKMDFEINPSMQVSIFFYNDIDYLQWINKNNIYFFEIFFDESNEINKNNFLKTLEKCLCSLTNNIPFEKVTNEIDINSLKHINNIGRIDDFGKHVDKIVSLLEKEDDDDIYNITKEIKNLLLVPVKLDTVINLERAKKVLYAKGELYNYDINKEELINLNKDKITFLSIYYLTNTNFEYILCTETSNEYIISIDILNSHINGKIINNKTKKFFCWTTNKCYTNIIGNCIGFIFDDNKDCSIFEKILNKCNDEYDEYNNIKLYESKNINNNDNNNNNNIINNNNINNINNINYSSQKKINYININNLSSDEEDNNEESEEIEENDSKSYEMDIDEDYKEIESSKENLNLFSLDSLSNDRTYCITDDKKIMAYKINQENNTIEKIGTSPIVQEYKGNRISPRQGLLYKSERNILFLDENNPKIIHQYDLTKEKIINNWKSDNVEISDICSIQKNGQTTDNSLIYGVNSKSIFTLDDRVNNKNNIVDIKNYSNKNYSNKIMSTNNGEFMTGSIKGELRLYDKIGGKARNVFSFYGDPIKHIDISSDDKFILITCDKYLLLVNIMNKDGKKSGFYNNIKNNNRATPIRLQIKNNDIIEYGLANANYTAGKFNMNKNGENNIITSLGEYIIIWNFNDIKKGKFLNYKIKRVNDLIIENTFKVGKGDKIIITLPNKVRIQNQKKIFTD